MNYTATSAAGLPSRHGIRLFRKAALAVLACAWATAVSAWIADVDPVAWIRDSAFAKGAGALSFDDRFGPGSALSPGPINYPYRPIVQSSRLDFDKEFEQIRDLLAGPSLGPRIGQAHPSTPSTSTPPTIAAVPLPKTRPVEANVALKTDPPPAHSDDRTLLQKLADLMPARLTLASLTPGDGLLTNKPDLGPLAADNLTAVYDISAHVVYMPNGSRLEAHSGLGSRMDDPYHVSERNVGATPPNIYDLKPREQLFHGVPALRMIPVGENDTLGRSGLLVHSYMLGPNGDSNGCVSIRDYDKFLSAYNAGAIKRLVVVPNLSEGLSTARRSTSQL